MEGNTERVLKKAGVGITMDEFENMLHLISWKLRGIGADHYAPINNRNERTGFECREETVSEESKDGRKIWKKNDIKMELFWRDDVFGSEGGGGQIYIHLKKCSIELNEGTIYIYPKKGDGMGIHLYNFDTPYTEPEKFINALPKDYVMRAKCSECGAKIMESKRISALELVKDWILVNMSAPLNAPRCPKCKYSSYSDCNMALDKKIIKLSTNRPVTYDHVEKIAAPLKYEYNELVVKMEEKKKKPVNA